MLLGTYDQLLVVGDGVGTTRWFGTIRLGTLLVKGK